MNRYNFVTACISAAEGGLRREIRRFLDTLIITYTEGVIPDGRGDYMVYYSGSFVSEDGREINDLTVSFRIINAI